MAEVKQKYRNELIDKIKSINDKNVIDEIYRLIEVDLDDAIYVTTQDQKLEISKAQQQLDSGQDIISQQADKDIDQWLSK